MQYFVTGATGFIGKRLVKKLLERKGAVVHFLIRKESADKVADLRAAGADDFMQKPFALEKLVDRVCELLDLEKTVSA